ncbi:hypothetical protein QJV45_14330 [Listeria booriae]|uniref:hypothetical protein n=1 Tax=Listeria booriae TaxID=1552123 RepID=UPI00287FF832|nr:hypothetical protein [Listeria booriae]MDT0111657.1 hypothetical protein [Listeria booriae]
MTKSKLQIKREEAGYSIDKLADKAADKLCDAGHLELVIVRIERGRIVCPKPRKTYEWKALAKALKCKVVDIWEEV